jgi:hypothetical protein
MDTGDEIRDVLKRFASEQKLTRSSFKAIGALSHLKLGWFNWESKKYELAAEFNEQGGIAFAYRRYRAQRQRAAATCTLIDRLSRWDGARWPLETNPHGKS